MLADDVRMAGIAVSGVHHLFTCTLFFTFILVFCTLDDSWAAGLTHKLDMPKVLPADDLGPV